jgi:hypothetical protein
VTNDASHNQTQRTAAAAQQIFLRAFVGSLVFCAALATPSAKAQALSFDAQNAARRAAEIEKRRARVSSRLLRELLAEVRKLTTAEDFALSKVIEVSIEADAVGNPDDDPLHSFTVKTGETTDPFWADVFSRLGQDLRGGALHRLLADAGHVEFTLKLDAQKTVATLVADFDSAARASAAADAHKLAVTRALGGFRRGAVAPVLNNMTASASGKQLSLKLEMSREQSGNLLRTLLALP